MASRRRNTATETLHQYHGNLKTEAKLLKRRLAGFTLWPGERGMARRDTKNGKPALTNKMIQVAGDNHELIYSDSPPQQNRPPVPVR